MKIDLHVHCRERSTCAVASENDLIHSAISAGLDAIAFTDHDYLVPATHLAELNRRFAPFRIFGGIEITLAQEHILVFGIQDPVLESRNWNYTDLWHFVRQEDGFMALAHPFRFQDYIGATIDLFPPDAIEVHSLNTAARHETRIRTLARNLGMRPLSNSDSHTTVSLGRFYNQLPRDPQDDQQMIRALKESPFATSPQ